MSDFESSDNNSGHDVNYTVKVKNGAKWRQYSVARLQISVGGDRHEGRKFEATTSWCARNFEKVIVCVNDTLQRWNYVAQGFSPEEAYTISREKGDLWLARHQLEISALPQVEVYRWDDWRLSKGFLIRHAEFKRQYDDNTYFQQRIAESMKNRCSVEYLLEEVAIFSLMYERDHAVDIYPGTLAKVLDVLGGHTTRIDFTRRKSA